MGIGVVFCQVTVSYVSNIKKSLSLWEKWKDLNRLETDVRWTSVCRQCEQRQHLD